MVVRATDVENWFTYHRPAPHQVDLYTEIREAAKTFSQLVVALTPPGIEQDAAVASIRESVMWANAAIACDVPPVQS